MPPHDPEKLKVIIAEIKQQQHTQVDILRTFYTQCVSQGFKPREALVLTTKYMETVIK